MIPGRKIDSEEILAHIKVLKAHPWLGEARAWWPDYLFRFDNIVSAAMILNSDKLLSRAAALATGAMSSDSASPGVIASTADRWKGYVRLYFRPRTPTQYANEGFRPVGSYNLDAHCPVPVVMLFDAADILTRASTQFSNGNLAADPEIGSSAVFLKGIPFELIYHSRPLLDEIEKRQVIFHRNAEVIIPKEMDLLPLRFVGCRTQAEYETLLHLLEPQARRKWSQIIGVRPEWNLHYHHWAFVEQVKLNSKAINFLFNPLSRMPGPFRVRVDIREDTTGNSYFWEHDCYVIDSSNPNLPISLSELKHPERYTVSLKLDDQLAYSNRYTGYNVPV